MGTKYVDIYEDLYTDMICPNDKNIMSVEKLLKFKSKNSRAQLGKNIFVTSNVKDFTFSFPLYHCSKCETFYDAWAITRFDIEI